MSRSPLLDADPDFRLRVTADPVTSADLGMPPSPLRMFYSPFSVATLVGPPGERKDLLTKLVFNEETTLGIFTPKTWGTHF